MLGAIVPDIDYMYQYFFDYQNYDHHLYPTHYPLFWLTLMGVSIVWYFSHKKSKSPLFALMFSLNGFIHMILDTVEGRILWIAPFSYQWISGSSILREFTPSFIDNHPGWNSVLEAFIFVIALFLFVKNLHTKRINEEKDICRV